ncbi:MAG: dTMP kinase [Bacteriovoracaceae bacterium]
MENTTQNSTNDLSHLCQEFRSPAFPGSYFLSFEGIEGAGKSTQIAKLSLYLEEKGYRVLTLREPGGTSFGERLRSAILNSSNEIHPLAEAHLFASSRAQLLHEVCLKELEKPGTIIIYDRYLDSSLAYQGHARGLGLDSVLRMHLSFPLHLVPHLTFYLRIPLETSIQRQALRNLPKDYFESRNEDFHRKLIEGYDQVAELFPSRIKQIQANVGEDQVYESIVEAVDNLISAKD